MLYLLPLLTGLLTTHVNANIGYFWHITDLHWDTNYFNSDCRRQNSEIVPLFGEHNCDSPWNLIESAVWFMYKTHGEIEFVLWTGDGLAHLKSESLQSKVAALQNITHLLSQAFSSQFVFPVLGHEDVELDLERKQTYQRLSGLWKHWLPSEALHTFNQGGFYTIEQKERKLRLIALNTNLFVKEDEDNAADQWLWLEQILHMSHVLKETVYLVGHMPPGVDERHGTPAVHMMAPRHNARFVSLVKKYAHIINGQFFGHLHSDTFRIIYNDTGAPVSCIFVAPSVTPRRSSVGINNPGLRLYKFHKNSGQIIDYLQYFLDLSAANQGQVAKWELEYSLTDYYGLAQVSPSQLHKLAESFTSPDGYNMFRRYFLANSVRSYANQEMSFNTGTQNLQYCAITNVELPRFHACLASAALALAASNASLLLCSRITLLLTIIVYTIKMIKSISKN